MCAGVLRRQCKHWNEQGRKKKKDTGIQKDPKKLWKGKTPFIDHIVHCTISVFHVY